MSLSASVFGLLIGVGALAWWILVCWPSTAPRTKGGVAAWFCAALGATVAALLLFAPLSALTCPLAAFVLVVLPSGVCSVLAAAWSLRLLGEALTSKR